MLIANSISSPFPIKRASQLGLFVTMRDCRGDSPLQRKLPIPHSPLPMIKILHLSDIHLGSGFSHGKINPATGVNTRLEDFVKTLSQCIDRAIAEAVD